MPSCTLTIEGGVSAQVTSSDCPAPYVVPNFGDIRLETSPSSIAIGGTGGGCGRLVLVLPLTTSVTEIVLMHGAALILHGCGAISSTLRLTVGPGSTAVLPSAVASLQLLEIVGAGIVCCAGGLFVTHSLHVQSQCHADSLLQVSGIRVLGAIQTTLNAAYDFVCVCASSSVKIVNSGVTAPRVILDDEGAAD